MSGNSSRLEAIRQITNRAPLAVSKTELQATSGLGRSLISPVMEWSLSKKAVKKTIQTSEPLDPATADVVAAAMKESAIAKGAKFF